jgi:hypothetical protein
MILVTGATGNIGRPLIDPLYSQGAPASVALRKPRTAALPPMSKSLMGTHRDPTPFPPRFGALLGCFSSRSPFRVTVALIVQRKLPTQRSLKVSRSDDVRKPRVVLCFA